jgi:hypothetical protein
MKSTPTPLCLACASSLLPRQPPVHTTACCARPICGACLISHPRLARYNPCLACLSGVGASKSTGTAQTQKLDGALKDDAVVSIGDDDAGEDGKQKDVPPPYISRIATPTGSTMSLIGPSRKSSPATIPPNAVPPAPTDGTSGKRVYHLKPTDTLSGLALRFHVSPRALCTANKLPPSTMTTQPHLLHTRTSIIIPTPDGGPAGLSTTLFSVDDEEPVEPESPKSRYDREAKRARERAAVRLATLTKETDPSIARAYVALAEEEGDDDVLARRIKAKELSLPSTSVCNGLEGVAVDAYLEDEEWENEMRKKGKGPPVSRGQGSALGRLRVW